MIAYLPQLVQRTLSDAALFEVVLGRIHYLLDDLLIDIALSTALATGCHVLFLRLQRPPYHQRVCHGREYSKGTREVPAGPLSDAGEMGAKACWSLI